MARSPPVAADLHQGRTVADTAFSSQAGTVVHDAVLQQDSRRLLCENWHRQPRRTGCLSGVFTEFVSMSYTYTYTRKTKEDLGRGCTRGLSST